MARRTQYIGPEKSAPETTGPVAHTVPDGWSPPPAGVQYNETPNYVRQSPGLSLVARSNVARFGLLNDQSSVHQTSGYREVQSAPGVVQATSHGSIVVYYPRTAIYQNYDRLNAIGPDGPGPAAQLSSLWTHWAANKEKTAGAGWWAKAKAWLEGEEE